MAKYLIVVSLWRGALAGLVYLLVLLVVAGWGMRVHGAVLVQLDFNTLEGESTLANHGSLGGTFVLSNPSDFSYNTDVPPNNNGRGFSGNFFGGTTYAAATLPNQAGLNGFTSFTIGAWMKTTGSRFHHIVQYASGSGGFILQIHGSDYLRLGVNGVFLSDTATVPANEWRFVAVTYDGTLTADNVRFYIGDGQNLSSTEHTHNQGTVNTHETNLFIGRAANPNNAGANLLDNAFIHGVTSGSGGVLTHAQLFDIMNQADNVIPEPGTMALLGLSLFACWWGRRRLPEHGAARG